MSELLKIVLTDNSARTQLDATNIAARAVIYSPWQG